MERPISATVELWLVFTVIEVTGDKDQNCLLVATVSGMERNQSAYVSIYTTKPPL